MIAVLGGVAGAVLSGCLTGTYGLVMFALIIDKDPTPQIMSYTIAFSGVGFLIGLAATLTYLARRQRP